MQKWYLLAAVALGLLPVPCQALQEGVPVLPEGEYQTILQPEKEGEVYVLTFTAKEWCPPCEKFEENILPSLVAEYEGVHFYLVDMTKPTEKDWLFAKQLNIDRYPTTVVLRNGIATSAQVGYDKEKGGSEIEKILAPYKK